MAGDQNHKEVEMLLAQAGISVPEPRLPALAFAVVGTLAQLKAICSVDYGITDIASRFRAPR